MNSETEKLSLRENLELIGKLDILNLIIAIAGIAISNMVLYELVHFENEASIKHIVFFIIMNTVMIYYTVNLLMSKLKIKKLNRYIEFLDARNRSLMELNDNIRSFKHDFNNIIQAIDGYILIGDMKALKVYFSKLLEECNHVKNLEILACSQKVNPAIYGVLLNKYKIAEDKNIRMNIDVLMDFTKIQKKSYCLSRIIGILLDNAIEATLECEEKIINVQFSQTADNKQRQIIIENTYNDKSIDTNKIFEKNYTTKKGKGNSGLGLWKVRSMIEKESKMFLKTTKDRDMFKQEIKINL